MPFTNIDAVAQEWKHIAGREAEVGAAYFHAAFDTPAVKNVFPTFKDNPSVLMANLLPHGGIVFNFLRDKIINGNAQKGMEEYVKKHMTLKGVTVDLIANTKTVFVNVCEANKMNGAVMGVFFDDFIATMRSLWGK